VKEGPARRPSHVYSLRRDSVGARCALRSQRARVALAEERQRAGELLAENRRLAAEAAETGLDAWETVAFLRAELLGREAEVARLGAALAQARGCRGDACHGPAHACTPGSRSAERHDWSRMTPCV